MKEESSDYSPLSVACVKALTDKLYDKRKSAALEIEKMVRDFNHNNNTIQINRLVQVLGQEFCLSNNPNARKGGLIGLAAVMIALRSLPSPTTTTPKPPVIPSSPTSSSNQAAILENVVRPILTCVLDPDSRVRYYACESLYNVIKVARSSINPIFNEIFDCLARIIADPDSNVRSGAELLDRLLKDIISEDQGFDLASFVPRLRECIYTKNPFARLFIISWIRLLDSVPDSELVTYLPELLDGLFNCLYDSTEEIRASTLSVLSEFLNEIVTRPNSKIEIPSMINILIIHSQTEKEELVQYTAIAWLRQFIGLMDDVNLLAFTPGILTAILPCLAFQINANESVLAEADETMNHINQSLHIQSSSTMLANICETATMVNAQLQEQVTNVLSLKKTVPLTEALPGNELESIVEVLTRELHKIDHPTIKLAIMEWFKKLRQAEPDLIFANLESESKLFSVLLETLSDRCDEVVKATLKVLADIFCFAGCTPENCQTNVLADTAKPKIKEEPDKKKTTFSKIYQKSPEKNQSPQTSSSNQQINDVKMTANNESNNFNRFMIALVDTFKKDEIVFIERGSFIIVLLCCMMEPEYVYKSFANILKDEKKDLKFAYNMVQKLNEILLTSQELFKLRSRLRFAAGSDDADLTSLFLCLYQAWCHSPIATLSLCLLTSNHRHASDLVMALANIDMTMEILTEIDKLVQLIESPIFAFLRIQLLDSDSNHYLLKSLYGLLMVLPQSEAFRKLRGRLKCVPNLSNKQSHSGTTTQHSIKANAKQSSGDRTKNEKASSQADLESLTKHFKLMQELHSGKSESEI